MNDLEEVKVVDPEHVHVIGLGDFFQGILARNELRVQLPGDAIIDDGNVPAGSLARKNQSGGEVVVVVGSLCGLITLNKQAKNV